jgi:hypothetical protein
VVDLDESVGAGGYVFAFDAADLTENIEQDVSIGGRVDATPEECVEQVRRLKAIAAERGYPLIPGHDPSSGRPSPGNCPTGSGARQRDDPAGLPVGGRGRQPAFAGLHLGDVHTDEPGVAGHVPQLGALPPRAGVLDS